MTHTMKVYKFTETEYNRDIENDTPKEVYAREFFSIDDAKNEMHNEYRNTTGKYEDPSVVKAEFNERSFCIETEDGMVIEGDIDEREIGGFEYRDKDLVLRTIIEKDGVQSAEQILLDNGIDADECQSVLQAIAYALMDIEIYKEDEDEDDDVVVGKNAPKMPWD